VVFLSQNPAEIPIENSQLFRVDLPSVLSQEYCDYLVLILLERQWISRHIIVFPIMIMSGSERTIRIVFLIPGRDMGGWASG